MKTILVLHGPNLNLLGEREPEQYGRATLAEIDRQLKKRAAELQLAVETLQSNAEHELVEAVHRAGHGGADFILINPGGLTHTSVVLRDALLAVGVPFIEVHLSNIHRRESFRRRSYFSDIARGTICGLGARGYELALLAARDALSPEAS